MIQNIRRSLTDLLAREIQAAVLADAECAQPAQRSCKAVMGGAV